MASLQLIKQDMTLNEQGLRGFVQTLGDGGARYTALSIIGPQSSGKSTLLNALFGTDFKVMDDSRGWTRTTLGICLGKSDKRKVLIMDIEGSDSGERQGQTKFERQFAAFSFATSQIVLVNMKNDSIGRDSGGCKSLLEAALEFMVCFLGHRKITMLIVVRDKHPKTPVHKTVEQVKGHIEKIWTEIIWKPEGLLDKKVDDCFDLKVFVMHSYIHEEAEFTTEVSKLLYVIVNGQEGKKYSAKEFAGVVREQWQIIRSHPEFNIQTYKELIDDKRCCEVTQEYVASFGAELSKILAKQPTEFSGCEVEKSLCHSLDKHCEATQRFTISAAWKWGEDLESKLMNVREHWLACFPSQISYLISSFLVTKIFPLQLTKAS